MLERMKEKRNEGGFTLIELLIVIIILAILAAIVVFAVGTTTKNAVAASCRADAKSVEVATEAYHAQTGVFPAAIGNLTTSTVTNGSTVGPWLRAAPGSLHYTIVLGASNGTLNINNANTTGDFDATQGVICDSMS
jgi:prepilin-type N-terminal cleavage/methylation domain-containing protein